MVIEERACKGSADGEHWQCRGRSSREYDAWRWTIATLFPEPGPLRISCGCPVVIGKGTALDPAFPSLRHSSDVST